MRIDGRTVALSFTAGMVVGVSCGFFLDRGSEKTAEPAKVEAAGAPYEILGQQIGRTEDEAFRLCATASGIMKGRHIDFSAEEVCFELLAALDCRKQRAGARTFDANGYIMKMTDLFAAGINRYEARKKLHSDIVAGL
jgi:hypothetical protein